MTKKPPTRAPWWVPILLGFLGVTACYLTIAYITWIQVGGRIYWFGVVMTALNLAATVAAIVATGVDARTGRVSWRWWAVLGAWVVFSMLMFGFMGNFA